MTLGAFNRGWQASERMGWLYSIGLNCIGLVGHLTPDNWTPTIFDIRLGAPFIVQTRLNWILFRRFKQKLRAGDVTNKDELALDIARANDPVVVQLVGTRDDIASPMD